MPNATELLDKIPLWGVFVATLVIALLSMECGFWVGKRKRSRSSDDEVGSGPFTGAVLGLLAFMLAIVYGSVETRLQSVKAIALDESNAVGTVYLRADVLSDSDRADVQRVLREYVELRIGAGAAQVDPGETLGQRTARMQEYRDVLWSKAMSVAEEVPTDISALFVDSVNELINLSVTTTFFSVHYRVPGAVWLVLYVLTIIGMMLGGYTSALAGSRYLAVIVGATATAYSMALLLVVALDRPQGAFSVADTALIELRETMESSALHSEAPRN